MRHPMAHRTQPSFPVLLRCTCDCSCDILHSVKLSGTALHHCYLHLNMKGVFRALIPISLLSPSEYERSFSSTDTYFPSRRNQTTRLQVCVPSPSSHCLLLSIATTLQALTVALRSSVQRKTPNIDSLSKDNTTNQDHQELRIRAL